MDFSKYITIWKHLLYDQCEGFSHEYFVDTTSDMNTAKPIEII